MKLLLSYQNELLIALIIFISGYIIFKLLNKKDTISKEETTSNKVTVATQTVNTQEQKDYNKTTNSQDENIVIQEESLAGKEEGDFGVTPEQSKKENSKEVLKKEKKAFKKRSVPPHSKIIKDDFKKFSGSRILIAEDNIINQKVISGLLAESGIEIVIANDGIEVLEILQNDSNFSIILMDAHMPRMDGFEATKKIRSNPDYDHIVVVALSGDTAADDIKKMHESGMSEHLEKPLKMDPLYDILYAYTFNEASNSAIIDFNEGLYICGDDKAFYKEILKEFYESYYESAQQIEELLKVQEYSKIDKLLLDLVGISANIGAEQLTTVLRDFKESLKTEDSQKQNLLFEKTKSSLARVFNEIKSYLKSN
jgi:CheY-like chemotaxis protein/HPt (histidine-containing phosphotransfer) domain-containing protein